MESTTGITDFLRPILIDEIELHEQIHDYKIKTRQFIENTGKYTIAEKNCLVIRKVTISGILVSMDITDTIILLSGQTEGMLSQVVVDTNLIQHYTVNDIEPGTTKIMEVEYMTDDVIAHHKKVRCVKYEDVSFTKVYDPTQCVDGVPVGTPMFNLTKESATNSINSGRSCGV